MKNYPYDDNILCPQITSVIVTILKIFGPLGLIIPTKGYFSIFYGFLGDPIISIILTIFIIIGIKNKNYGYYICAQVTCIIFSILETIGIAFVIIFIICFGDFLEKYFKDIINRTSPDSTMNKTLNDFLKWGFTVIKAIIIIGLSLNTIFEWILTCVLICYNKRVRYHCDNITTKQIGSMISQPLV